MESSSSSEDPGVKQLNCGDEFSIYLIFKPANDTPAGGVSDWVAVKRADWELSWCATNPDYPTGNNNWTINPATVGDRVSVENWVNDTMFGSWNSKVQDLGAQTYGSCANLPSCP